MTHRVQSQTGFPNKYFPLIQFVSLLSKYCILLCITSNLNEKIGNPEGETGGRLLQQWPSTDGPSSDLTQLRSSKPVFCQVQSDIGPSVKREAIGPSGRGLPSNRWPQVQSDLGFSKAYSSKHKRAKNLKTNTTIRYYLKIILLYQKSLYTAQFDCNQLPKPKSMS